MEQLEISRRAATSDPFLIYGFYDRLQENINKLNLSNLPDHVWNIDETSFSSDPTRIKGVAGKGQKVYRNLKGSGKENTSVMTCISASGTLLPPLIIFQGLRLWSSWKGQHDIPNTLYACSEKGWMTTNIFQEWFIKFCEIVPQRPLLIILDGHITHLDKTTLERAIAQDVTLLKLPAHTTDLLQPLDRCCFGPLKLRWNEKLINWQREHQRKLSKSEFADLLCEVWLEGIDKETIISSFSSTGVFPCNKAKYPIDRLDPEKLKRYNNTTDSEDQLEIFENQYLSEQSLVGANADAVSSSFECQTGPTDSTENVSVSSSGPASNISPAVPSTSNDIVGVKQNVSFESLLLAKVKRTAPNVQKRRKIDGSAKVLTSFEYMQEIVSKTNKEGILKKKRMNKKKIAIESDSDEDDFEKICEDESDVENLDYILQDEIEANPILDNSPIQKDDYVLVQFPTKKRIVHYVALVESVTDDCHVVSYLQRKGNSFIYPLNPETYEVDVTDIVMKLPKPTTHGGTERLKKSLIFEIDLSAYNVQ